MPPVASLPFQDSGDHDSRARFSAGAGFLLVIFALGALAPDTPAAAGARPSDVQGALLRFSGPSGARVLGQTVMQSDILALPGKETVVLTEFLTGLKGERDSVNVVLDVYPGGGAKDAAPVATRDYLKEKGGPVAGGELVLVDLDWDGTNEVLVSFHHSETAGSVSVLMDVLHEAGEGLKTIWSGPVRVDNSTASSTAPASERERFSREIDYKKTGRTRGGMIVFQKKVFVAAGVPLQPPVVVEESFPLAAPK